MKDLVLMLAAIVPEEEIVKEVKDAAEKYLAGDKEQIRRLQKVCVLLLSKEITGNSMEGALKASKRLDEMEYRDKLHEPIKS